MWLVDIDIALPVIIFEPVSELFNLNSKDELIPSELCNNLKSQRLWLSVPALKPVTDADALVVVILLLPALPPVIWVRTIEPLEFARSLSPPLTTKNWLVSVKKLIESDTSIFPKCPFGDDIEVDTDVAISSIFAAPDIWIRTLPEPSTVPLAPSLSSSNI